MHVLPTSSVKFSESQVNHTFLGTFCLLFRKFALKQGQNFGADAPYWRVGFAIPKWHTRVQKLGENPPPGIWSYTPKCLWWNCSNDTRFRPLPEGGLLNLDDGGLVLLVVKTWETVSGLVWLIIIDFWYCNIETPRKWTRTGRLDRSEGRQWVISWIFYLHFPVSETFLCLQKSRMPIDRLGIIFVVNFPAVYGI